MGFTPAAWTQSHQSFAKLTEVHAFDREIVELAVQALEFEAARTVRRTQWPLVASPFTGRAPTVEQKSSFEQRCRLSIGVDDQVS